MQRFLLFAFLIIFSATTFAMPTLVDTSGASALFDPAQKPKLISHQFTFTEGPAVDKAGNVFFTDQPNNKIWKYDVDGKLSVFLDKTGRSNGMYFDQNGNLVTCADEKNELWSIDKNAKHKVLLSNYKGHTFNGPNDLWIDAKGNIFFTDPYYHRDYWERQKPDSALGGQRLYYLAKTAKAAVLADSDLVQPNGITGSPDGKYLYVADMGRWKTFRYKINAGGKLTDRKIFCDEASDGMTVDEKGNVYLTGKGVMVYNSKGQKIGQIDIPEKWTANVCFGGKKKNILFITASEGIYTLPMKVRGVE
jgi:gluconolactonase